MNTTTTGVNQAARAERLRVDWIEVHGSFHEHARQLLEQDPSYFERVLDFTAHAWRHGVLPGRIKALILLAVDSACSHLWGPGTAQDVRRALALGASPEEVLETLELTSTMGIHAANTGVPILLEELAAAGRPLDLGSPLSERQEQIKREFTESAAIGTASVTSTAADLRYGASAEELMEVFELASGIGVESSALALPALRDAIEGSV